MGAPPDAELFQLAEQVGKCLGAVGLSVVTVESCTGGWVAKALTDVPGSSAWFEMGLVTYANGAKQQFLGVDQKILAAHGAVSAQTVTAMAQGGLDCWPRATLAVAVSGVAGPDGGTAEKPVGTVWFAFADARRAPAKAQTECLRFAGDRREVRAAATAHALRGLQARI